MNKDQIHELLLGVALVALAYAAYQHFKGAPAVAPQPFKAPNPIAPSQGVAYNPANPGQWLSLDNLLAGTVHDLATTPGGTAGYIPSTDDQIAAVAGVSPSPIRDSIVLPGMVPPWE